MEQLLFFYTSKVGFAGFIPSLTLHLVAFYFICMLSLVSALCVVLVKNPIKSVLFLILTFFLTSGLWLFLEAEFLAILLIIVYVGAVMVLFLFAVMLLHIENSLSDNKFVKNSIFYTIVLISLVVVFLYVITTNNYMLTHIQKYTILSNYLSALSNTKELGISLYLNYLFEFEVIGILLLVGIVSAITLIFRGRQNRKSQDPSEQIEVKYSNRVGFKNGEEK